MPEIPSLEGAIPPPCRVFLPYCEEAPVVVVMAGCVHEHLVELAACQWHVEALASDAQFCGPCVHADGHLCELALIRIMEPIHA